MVKHYFRYLDDMVILADNKPYLHELLYKIMAYLSDNLKLTVKKNYQVFKVEDRGIDFVGYKKYHRYVFKEINQKTYGTCIQKT
jgi:RNA-directed DNA polymerase